MIVGNAVGVGCEVFLTSGIDGGEGGEDGREEKEGEEGEAPCGGVEGDCCLRPRWLGLAYEIELVAMTIMQC